MLNAFNVARANPIGTAAEADAAYWADMKALKREKVETDKKLGMVGAAAAADILGYFFVFKKD